MGKIIIGNTLCSIKDEEDFHFLRQLDKELSFKVQGAEHTYMYKTRQWDGVKRIMGRDLTFPYGLLDRVLNFYNSHNKEIDLEDRRPVKTEVNSIDILPALSEMNKTPYPYQMEALEVVKKKDCGIIRVATGGGKCNCVESLNFSELGLLSYEELLKDKEISLEPQEAKIYKSNIATPLTKNGLDKTSMIYRDGYGKSFHIKTSYGYEIKATPDHRIKVLTSKGITWKYVKDLQLNDYAVISNNIDVFGTKTVDVDEAYWFGLLLGDGGMTTKYVTDLTNQDNHILSFSKKYLDSQNIKYKIVAQGNNVERICINNINYRNYLFSLGFKRVKSIHKEIPMELRKLTKPLLAVVVRGLYETDGWVGKEKSKPTINISLSSKKMIDQLHLILLNYGIVASRRLKKTTHEDSHQLIIYREFIPKFVDEIGFDPKGRKFQELQKELNFIKDKSCNSNSNLIFNQSETLKQLFDLIKRGTDNIRDSFKKYGQSYNTVRSWLGHCAWRNPSKKSLKSVLDVSEKILEECSDEIKNKGLVLIKKLNYLCSDTFFFDPIVSIEETFTDNYDFVVPDTHSFVSQGFVNHNTLIAALMTAYFGKSACLYVIGKDLLHQMHGFFSKIFDQEIGIVGDGLCEIHDINIVSVWTVGQAVGMKKSEIISDVSDGEKKVDPNKYQDISAMMKEAKVHIFDECHLAACDTIQNISRYINPEHIYGMSASPWRDDGADLLIESIFGHKIVEVPASFLIENGYLAKPLIRFKTVPKVRGLPDSYPSVYKHYITDNEVRNDLVIEAAVKMVEQGYQTLILYQRVSHGKLLFKKLKEKMPCMLLSGKDSNSRREEVKQKLEDGEINAIVASTIFDIGVDLPSLSGLVIAGGGKSSVRALQRIGRVVRKYPGKEYAAIIDFLDQAKFLKGHSQARYQIYASERGFDVTWPKK